MVPLCHFARIVLLDFLAWHDRSFWHGVPMPVLWASTILHSLEICLLDPPFMQHLWVFLFPSTKTPENMKTLYMSKFRVKEAYLTLVLWSLTQKSLRRGVKIEFKRRKNGRLSAHLGPDGEKKGVILLDPSPRMIKVRIYARYYKSQGNLWEYILAY